MDGDFGVSLKAETFMDEMAGGSLVTYESALGLRGRVTETSWELPSDFSEEEWELAGRTLGKIERSVSWWIGDWWAFGEFKFRCGKKIIEADDWDGPSYGAVRNASVVCRSVPMSRRRDTLSFAHHTEIAALSPAEGDALLDWAEEPIALTGKPRSTRELRGEVNRRRVTIGSQPSDDTCTTTDLEALAASGRRFGCIYVDPPWLYDNQGTRAATSNHYSGLTVEQLCELPVQQLAADDAHLHLWVTNAFLRQAFNIIDAWGFEFRSTFVWDKELIGIGNYWRNSHELMLTAVRGDAKRFNDRSMPSVLSCKRGIHSAKPEQVRAMIERASPGPYLELFGRLPVQGWMVWGNQIERNLFTREAS
jgi:N6-adenosine-specific RNA methylase IME4